MKRGVELVAFYENLRQLEIEHQLISQIDFFGLLQSLPAEIHSRVEVVLLGLRHGE